MPLDGAQIFPILGNDGAYGSFYSSSPGTGIDVIVAASVENLYLIVQNATLSNGHAPISYFSFTPLPIPGSLPIYATSTNTSVTDDACNPLPSSTPNLANYVVIIRRGTCTFVSKLQNAAAFGAKYFLIYNNVEGAVDPSVGNYTAAGISAEDGAYVSPITFILIFSQRPSELRYSRLFPACRPVRRQDRPQVNLSSG